jgi:hypothetical protein
MKEEKRRRKDKLKKPPLVFWNIGYLLYFSV